MSAMPSACQPSKKSGAASTQRRYFSTAASSSPTAMSPLASSNNASISGGSSLIPRGASALVLAGERQAGIFLRGREPVAEKHELTLRKDLVDDLLAVLVEFF